MTLESKGHDDGDYKNAADVLSAITGRPREEFDASGYEIPNFEEQELEIKDEEPDSSR